jgi:Fe-S-cluster containining protein
MITKVRPFSCDTKKYCGPPAGRAGSAPCCRRPSFAPPLSVGDYIRISGHLNKTPAELWNERGSIALAVTGQRSFGYLDAALGIKSGPCAFLNERSRCDIYPVRPMACAGFPFTLFDKGEEALKAIAQDIPCVNGVKPTKEQIEYGRSVAALYTLEFSRDKVLLPDGFHIIYAPPGDSIAHLASYAVHEQFKHDPEGRSDATTALKEDFMKLSSFLLSCDLGKFDWVLYMQLLKPILYFARRDEIHSILDDLSPKDIEEYSLITKVWNRLNAVNNAGE